MKQYGTILFMVMLNASAFSQDVYWQQALSYNIDVELNDIEKTLLASETIVYKNNSPKTLDFIWFHLWPNAYKDKGTALFAQMDKDNDRKTKIDKTSFGFIDSLAFTVNGKMAITEAHPNPQYIDIVKVVLPQPLPPGGSITIATPFKVKLPSYFSRSGYADGEFMACQWYPKPAVFDKLGWHEFPYLDMGEFYGEYASYKVNITLPSSYVVAATGVLQNKNELDMYKSIGAKNAANRKDKPQVYLPFDKNGKKTVTYIQDNVPDFAWFADKDFVVQYDTVQLQSGKVIDAFSFYHNRRRTIWNNSIDYIKDATRHYSNWIGDYAYPLVQAVEGPANNFSGGMEYPTITLITSPNAQEETLDAVIAHEVGHNWFMSMLGSNEREHTWMDEGMNTYFQFRYEAEKYRMNSVVGKALPEQIKQKSVEDFLDLIYVTINKLPMQPAIETPAYKFVTMNEYGLISYIKAAAWMYAIESSTSKEIVDAAFKNYFTKWKFKHPQPEDLRAAFEEVANLDLSNLFVLLNKEGRL